MEASWRAVRNRVSRGRGGAGGEASGRRTARARPRRHRRRSAAAPRASARACSSERGPRLVRRRRPRTGPCRRAGAGRAAGGRPGRRRPRPGSRRSSGDRRAGRAARRPAAAGSRRGRRRGSAARPSRGGERRRPVEPEPDPVAVRAGPATSAATRTSAPGAGPGDDPEPSAIAGACGRSARGSPSIHGHATLGDGRATTVAPEHVAGAERPAVDPPNPALSSVDARPEDLRDVDPARQREVGAGTAPVTARERDRRSRRERVAATRQQPPPVSRTTPPRSAPARPIVVASRTASVGPTIVISSAAAPASAPTSRFATARLHGSHAPPTGTPEVRPVRPPGVLDRRQQPGLDDLERHVTSRHEPDPVARQDQRRRARGSGPRRERRSGRSAASRRASRSGRRRVWAPAIATLPAGTRGRGTSSRGVAIDAGSGPR